MEVTQQDLPIDPDESDEGWLRIVLSGVLMPAVLVLLGIKEMMVDPKAMAGGSPRWFLIGMVFFVTMAYLLIRIRLYHPTVYIHSDKVPVMKRNEVIYRNTIDDIHHVLRYRHRKTCVYTIVFSDGRESVCVMMMGKWVPTTLQWEYGAAPCQLSTSGR